MKKLMAIIACLLMLTTGASTAEEKKPSIVVKGLYIGMDLQEVAKQIKLPDGWFSDPPRTNIFNAKISSITIYHKNLKTSDISHGRIEADEGGKVTEILLNSALVNAMFQAGTMEASEFAKKFAEAYNIPSFKPTDAYNGWYYTSPEGYKITVSDKKGVTIKKTLNAKETKGAFD